MSGFVGVRNREAPVTDELLAQLWQPIAHRGPDGEGRWAEATLGVAAGVLRVTPESAGEEQPFRHRSGAVVVFDGRLDNRDELLSALASNEVTARDPDVSLVAEAYMAWGERFPEHLNGEYALAVLDQRSQRLLLARDAVGTRPLVFTETREGDVIFGSEIKALLAHPALIARPNLDVLAEFLLGGNARATPWDTFFDGVRSVSPGVTVVATPSGVSWRTHWAFDPAERIRRCGHAGYVDEYRERFATAVARRARAIGPTGVLVSGGLDSSSVLAVAATSAGVADLVAVTYTFPEGSPGDESRYVRELERAFDIQVQRIPMTHADIVPQAERQVSIYEFPALNEAFAAQLTLWELLRQQGVRTYLTGLWGDQVLVDQTYLVDMFDRLDWPGIARDLRVLPSWMDDIDPARLRRRFVSDLGRWHVPRAAVPALRRLRARFAGPRHDQPWFTEQFRWRASLPASRPIVGGWSTASAHARSLFGRLRSPYNVLGMEMDGKTSAWVGLEESSPFLDRDLLALVMGIPGTEVTPAGFSRGLHREAMAGLVPESIRLRRDKADGTAMSNESLSRQFGDVREWFSDEAMASRMGIVDRACLLRQMDSMKALVDEAFDFEAGLAVLDVLGLEAWMRAFFEDPQDTGMRL